MPIPLGKKYAKYVIGEVGTLHIALLSTVAALPFSQRTPQSAALVVRRRVSAAPAGFIVADPERRH